MKRSFHIASVVVGLACAAAFAIVPFANADAGPAAKRATLSAAGTSTNTNTTTTIHTARKHMNLNNVKPKDNGCGG